MGQILENPAGLADLVDYQDNSIVSKIITKKDAGNVTIFAIDRGQSLSTHSAPYDAFVSIIDGQAQITVGDKFFVLDKGQGVIMPADIPHAVKAENKFKMLLVMIKS